MKEPEKHAPTVQYPKRLVRFRLQQEGGRYE